MPIHDWSRVNDGAFHDFHHDWTGQLRNALNGGLLPSGYYAQSEQSTPGANSDVLALRRTVVVRHVSGHRVVALVEIVSRGNTAADYPFRQLVGKIVDAIRAGVHEAVIDLHAPTPRDPHGVHAAIWEALGAGTFDPPAGRPLTLAGYDAGPTTTAYVEPARVGDELYPIPLYLARASLHVALPLEETYAVAYRGMPPFYKAVLEAP